MNEHDVLKKNRNFYIGVGGTVLEGLLSGSLFMLLYSVMQFLWSGQFDMNRVLALTGIIAVVFLLRILIYSYGYTKAQIGGAEVSKNIRLFMGDHLKRIPLSRFTQGQTGDYINTITSDVNNYEKILTHLLSGGERQRISIARAILKNSPILLLDEATASLDIENELAVKQAIANLLKEKKTVVMIAHTLSIVKNADQILVMGDGQIAESGTHEELLAKGGKYAAMWNAEQKISA